MKDPVRQQSTGAGMPEDLPNPTSQKSPCPLPRAGQARLTSPTRLRSGRPRDPLLFRRSDDRNTRQSHELLLISDSSAASVGAGLVAVSPRVILAASLPVGTVTDLVGQVEHLALPAGEERHG